MRILTILLVGYVLSACGVHEQLRNLDLQASEAATYLGGHQDDFYRNVDNQHRVSDSFVTQPWVVGRAEPLARALSLPKPLRQHIHTTLVFGNQRLNLREVAEKISIATQLPVRIQPEALLVSSQFLNSASTTGVGSVYALGEQPTVLLNGVDEPLASILDRICAQLDIYWRQYKTGIEFYKVDSQVFELKGLSLRASAHASLGSAGSSQEGFNSQSGTNLQSDGHELMAVVRARVETLLSGIGRVSAVSGGSTTLLVVDTPEVLAKVERYLQRENRNLSRRVRLVFEELTVELHNDSETAVSWGLLFNSARWAGAVLSPQQVGANAFSAGLQLGQGAFHDTEAVISAISTLGTVVRRNTVPVLSLNRRPVTHALRTTFTYVDRVESTPSISHTGNATQSISISQREQTVGSLLTLIPEALDDGQIMLSVAYDNTTAQPLNTVSVGRGDQALEVQQLTVEGAGMVQQVIVEPGRPLLISGFDRSEHMGGERRLNPGASLLLGGASKHAAKSLRTVILLTAQIEEGAE